MIKSKQLRRNHDGFSLLHMLPVIVLVVVAFVGGNVYQAQQTRKETSRLAAEEAERKKQAELSVKEDETAQQKEVEVPATLPEQKPAEQPAPKPAPQPVVKSKPTYTGVTISTTSADIGAENVVLTAKLPGTYSGTCKALVKLPDGSNAMWFDAAFGPSNNCSITVSKAKLTAGPQWKYYMSFKSSDGLTKGEHGGNLFNL